MCGISGVTGRRDIVQTLFQSIKNLEYRGYDSCGLALVNGNEVAIRKNTGGVDEVNDKEHLTSMLGTTGIAHTRWATHGKVTRINAHPHASMDQRFSIVHNGIIENYQDIRKDLIAQGVTFTSETDTETMVHLVALAYMEFGNVEEAFLAATRRLEGSYAFCMVTAMAPDTIYCVREGSPLVLGLSPQQNFVASDVNAFLQFTRETLVLGDGEYVVMTPDKVTIARCEDRQVIHRNPLHIEWDAETTRKGGYSHYMLKEIFDQPQTVLNALHTPQEGIARLATSILNAGTTYLVGVGTTYYVGLTAQYFFSGEAERYLPAISSDEFSHLAMLGADDLVITISQSGETFDTRKALEFAKKRHCKTACIVNVMGSSLSMMADQVIMQGSGPEICVVSTKAALAQIIILRRVSLELARIKGLLNDNEIQQKLEDLAAFPAIVERTLNELSGFVRNMADRTVHFTNWLVLGRGVYYPMALESALKMKEITYLHVEGMPAGFLKHGTLAMVDEKLISLLFIPSIEEVDLHRQTLSALEEIKARGGPVLGIVFENDHKALELLDYSIVLPPVPVVVAPFLEMIIGQLFAYFTALKLGRSIDKPRNLAKSVTVG